MKLEVGMYVRLQNDAENIVIINRIANVFKTTILTENDGSIYQGEYTKENVVKASYNIIDILEVGDVIKLFMEDDIDEEDTNIFELIAINYNDNEIGVFNSDFQIEFFPIENLREILTHEQMEQKAYKVGE
jgi:hypothetical protein